MGVPAMQLPTCHNKPFICNAKSTLLAISQQFGDQNFVRP